MTLKELSKLYGVPDTPIDSSNIITYKNYTHMTPKERAFDLLHKYFEQFLAFEEYLSIEKSKKCALIAVNEILSFIEDDRIEFSWKTYYQEVKQELEKL